MTNGDRKLLRGATILTMDPTIGDLGTGDVFMAGTEIAAVAPTIDVSDDVEVIDATGRIVIPGFVDTHRHMWEALARGYAPHHSLEQYYTDVLGRLGPALEPEDVYAGTLASARGALSSGITTIQDIANIQDSPAHTDAAVAALQDSGLRAVFAYGKSFPTMMREGAALPDDVHRVRSSLLHDDQADVTLALVTEWGEDSAELHNAELARELAVRTARHIASAFPVSRLRDLGVLLPGTTFIHGNGMTTQDLQIIADGGATLSVSPAIEQIMGHGIPVLATAPEGLPLSLSTDVEVTVAADFFTQMRAALQAGRSAGRGAGAERELTVRDVLALATREGAAALGLGGRTGSITPGKHADLVVLRADGIDVAPVLDPYSTVVLQMDRRHIEQVFRAGRAVVRDGEPVSGTHELTDRLYRIVDRLRRSGALR
jgi:5-methylthioadenosine/S-adenosylhomocysteine deaminase